MSKSIGSLARARPRRPASFVRADFRVRGRRRHGLTSIDVAALLARQGGVCAIHRTSDPGSRDWVIDHSHKLAALHGHPVDVGCPRCIRGVLCDDCNLGLGRFDDDPERLENAAAYLRHAREQLGG